MDPIGLVISSFGQIHSVSVSERAKIVEVNFSCRADAIPPDETLREIVRHHHSRDRASLLLESVTDERLCLRSLDEIADTTCFRDSLEPDDAVTVRFSVEKTTVDNMLSVYSYQHFSAWLLNRSVIELMQTFDNLLSNRSVMIFDLMKDDVLLSTRTVIFRAASRAIDQPAFDRIGRLGVCRQVSNFYNAGEYGLLPDDFHVVVSQPGDNLVGRFAQLRALLSMVYIGDSAALNDSCLTLRINGHRNASFSYQVDAEFSGNPELYRIYNWIYTDGNPVDKAIIARNVISLQCKYVDLKDMSEEAYSSIQSNFAFYQRDNVYKYLELKNKLSEFVLSMVSQVGEAILGLSDRFRGNIMAFLAFIVTVFFANISSSSPLTSIFTRDITLISYVVLLGSLFYMHISLQEMDFKLRKIKEGYFALKDNYRELLGENDLQEMFGKDKTLVENTMEAERHRKSLKLKWIITVSLLFLVIDYLSASPILFRKW